MSESKPDNGDDDARTVHLISTEGESFDVPLSVAKMSELVKTMITDDQDEEEAQEIPLPNVKTVILAKVGQTDLSPFCILHIVLYFIFKFMPFIRLMCGCCLPFIGHRIRTALQK